MINQLQIFAQGTANIADDRVLATGLTCRKCKHNQSWQCNSKVFHYCGIRKSKQTSNGQLKIKCKNTACNMFESIN